MTRKTFLLAACAAVLMAGAALADPLEGTWRTAPDDNGNTGLIEVAPCGAALCGTLVGAFDSGGTQVVPPDLGRLIIFDTEARGGGEYRGKVWAPDRDQTYNSRLMLDGDRLSVSGCVLGICRDGGSWQRVN